MSCIAFNPLCETTIHAVVSFWTHSAFGKRCKRQADSADPAPAGDGAPRKKRARARARLTAAGAVDSQPAVQVDADAPPAPVVLSIVQSKSSGQQKKPRPGVHGPAYGAALSRARQACAGAASTNAT